MAFRIHIMFNGAERILPEEYATSAEAFRQLSSPAFQLMGATKQWVMPVDPNPLRLSLFGLAPDPINAGTEDDPIDPSTNFCWNLGLGVECDVWQILDTNVWGWAFSFKREGEVFELLKYRVASKDAPAATREAEEGFRSLSLAIASIWKPPA